MLEKSVRAQFRGLLTLFFCLLCFRGILRPVGWNSEALIACVVEPENISAEDASDVFQSAESCSKWGDGPMSDVERAIHDDLIVLPGCLLSAN